MSFLETLVRTMRFGGAIAAILVAAGFVLLLLDALLIGPGGCCPH